MIHKGKKLEEVYTKPGELNAFNHLLADAAEAIEMFGEDELERWAREQEWKKRQAE